MAIETVKGQCINLYADCIAVRGACKSAIYDLTRQEIVRFPTVYLDILEEAQKDTVGTVLSRAGDEESRKSMIEFFEFLIDNEFVNISVDPRVLPRIGEIWETPCHIQNAIIDIIDQTHDYESIFQQLDRLGCEIVQIRCFSGLHTLEDLQDILSLTYHTSIQGIELILKYDPRNTDAAYIEFIESMPIISRLTVHCAPAAKELVATFGCSDESEASLLKKVTMIEERITSERHCGVINTGSLTPPTGTVFFENKLYNGCLNRKISIDAEGRIKNCPSMTVSFGHHRETSLMDIAMDNEFQSVWHLKKDTIKQCKDCEFRYACTDCRAYVVTPGDKFSKPLKCGYDPYTGTWEEWDRNPAKEWAIRHYAVERSVDPLG